jgi:hypothetical protein
MMKCKIGPEFAASIRLHWYLTFAVIRYVALERTSIDVICCLGRGSKLFDTAPIMARDGASS